VFEYIEGKLVAVTPYYIVVDNSGIGYLIQVGNPYSFSYKMGNSVKVFVHQIVREDAHSLYGFHSLEEKSLFLKLLSVSGIGPKSALAIMASEDHAGLIQAIATKDITYLTKFPGVGKKTASQMVLDLEGKLGELETLPEVAENILDAKENQVSKENISLYEAIEALLALGYSQTETKKVRTKLEKEEVMSTSEYMSLGMKLLMKK
jgi:Holliday junction DNA helicase RuvA